MSRIKILAPMGSRSFFGAERANIDLLSRMQQRGAEILCLVRHEDWPENILIREALSQHNLAWECATFPDYPSIRYWRYWPRVAIETPRRYLGINRQVEQAIRQRDFTHLHLFNPFQAASLRRAMDQTGIPVVYRCGEAPTRHNVFFRATWKWLAERVSMFVTESNFLQRALLDVSIEAEKVRVVRTPAPSRHAAATDHANRPNTPRNGVRFAYLGQISEFKGVGSLINAFKLVREDFPASQLHIAGPINAAWAEDLLKRCEQEVLEGNIVFVGAIEDVTAFLQGADVHIAPSLHPEGYGLVAVEAKQAGLPSIVFAEGGLAELVIDGVEGIAITEKSVQALADAMLTYCRDPARAKTDGRRALASLTDRLHVDRHDDAWWQVYTVTALGGAHHTGSGL